MPEFFLEADVHHALPVVVVNAGIGGVVPSGQLDVPAFSEFEGVLGVGGHSGCVVVEAESVWKITFPLVVVGADAVIHFPPFGDGRGEADIEVEGFGIV